MSRTQGALGFSEDEGREVYVSKVQANRRTPDTKSRKLYLDVRSLPKNLESTTEAPTYTKEILFQLKESTPNTPPSFTEDALVAEKFPSSMGTGPITGIPDPATIHAAKKKREMLRQRAAGGAPEYISLSDETDVISSSGKKLESRLVREEDEADDVDADFEKYVSERLPLGKKAMKEEEQQRKAGIEEAVQEFEYQGEEDEEVLQWEMEAIKKGGNVSKIKTPKKSQDTQLYIPAPIPAITPIPNIADSIARLSQQMDDFQDVHKNQQSELIQIQKDLQNLKSSREELASQIETAKRSYNYYQEMKTFVENLAEFLDVKLPYLEELENKFHNLLMDRLQSLAKIQTDGESFDSAMECKGSTFQTNDILQKFKHVVGEIEVSKQKLFDDVSDDFRSLDNVMSKFDVWRREFEEDYGNAYGDLSLTGVFELYVRYELISWDPFDQTTVDPITSTNWYRVLSEYGTTNSNNADSNDRKSIIIGKVIDKILIPKINRLTEVYKPYNPDVANRAIGLTDLIKSIV
ncbi:2510_t:CDS:10 [Paraglomus brasilianum]|uniref:2510_t:CDS:1 n=1 Tax=Paraglomus brasilianum TaxID=144538 RepID=A0A9N9AD42_9GLOM|nr:2510_t:CDS:10 [Paraglomus brasilianum]